MGKTKRKRRPSSEQKQTKECHNAGSRTHTKDKTKGKKRTSTKQKQTEEKVPHRSFKNARRRFVSYNEESDDEE